MEAAIKGCNGLINSSTDSVLKKLAELIKALRGRLSDTQINLKPLAARVIGSFLSMLDGNAQAKLGKLVYGPLMALVMNDMKKPTREASLEALQSSTTLPSLEGGGPNVDAIEGLVVAMTGEISESSIRVCSVRTLCFVASAYFVALTCSFFSTFL